MIKTGDTVRLTVGGETFEAQVIIASENGASLMLAFDGAARIGGGMALGQLPVLRGDDGTYSETLFNTPVLIEEIPHG